MTRKTKIIDTIDKTNDLYPDDFKCFKSFLFGLIKYSRVGSVSVLQVMGFSVLKKLCKKYSIFGVKIR